MCYKSKKCIVDRNNLFTLQRAKKVLSDSLGLVDFAIGLVNYSVFNLPHGQAMFFVEFK